MSSLSDGSAIAVGPPARSAAQRLGDLLGGHGWILASVWLGFLVFPVVAIWGSDETLSRKLVVTALMITFAVVYSHGFKVLNDRFDSQTAPRPDVSNDASARPSWLDRHPGSFFHFVALVALCITVVAVGGWGMLGTLIFIGAFAMMNLSIPAAVFSFVSVLMASLVLPALADQLDELWFFAAIVATVGLFTLMIRITDERHQERQEFQTRLAVSDERTRVARDVHDVLGHSLTVVTLKTELCQRLLELSPDDPDALEQCRQELAELNSISRRALAEIRTTVGGLRSAELADELAAARAVLADAGVTLTVTGDHSLLNAGERTLLTWVVRESVTNIIRHAQARNCVIAFEPEATPPHPVLRITDDGIGLGDRPEGNGLSGMRDRVAARGGSVNVTSPAGGASPSDGESTGTSIEVTL